MSRKFYITTGKTVRGSKVERKKVNWDIVANYLSKFQTADVTLDEYRALDQQEKADLKNAFGYYLGTYYHGNTRKKDEIAGKTLVTLDYDFIDGMWDVDAIQDTYADYAHVAHSSMSHSEDAPKLRLVFPTDRDMTLEEFEACSRMLASFCDIEMVDKVSYRPNQLMYRAARVSDVDPIYWRTDGEILSVDKILALYDDWRDFGAWPKSSRDLPVRDPAARAEDPRGKPGVIGAFCRAFSIHDVIAKFDLPYDPVEDDTDRYSPHGSTGGSGAIVYDDGLFLYSHHSSDAASDRNLNAFDLVRYCKFGDLDVDAGPDCSLGKLPSQKEMLAFADSQPEVREELAVSAGFEDLGPDKNTSTSTKDIGITAESSGTGVDAQPDSTKPKKSKLTFAGLMKEITALDPHTIKIDDCRRMASRIAAAKLDATEVDILAVELQNAYPNGMTPTKAAVLKDIDSAGKRLSAQQSTDGEISDIEEDLMTYITDREYNHGKHLRRTGAAWWTYEQGLWAPDSKDRVKGSVGNTVIHLRKDRPDSNQDIVVHVGESPTSAITSRIMSLFEGYIAIRTGRDDPLQLLRSFSLPVINCLNGELHFESNGDYELRPHSPESFMTSRVEVAYDPKATAKEWDRFCNTMFAEHRDPEGMKRHLEEFCGYTIQMSRWLKICAIMYGPGNNGKSTVAAIIKNMLGGAALGRDLARYAGERKGEFAEYDLLGKLIMIEDDLSKGVLLPDGWLKTISEEKKLTASVKYADPITFINRAFPLILSNHLPATRDLSAALRNRMQVFPMPHVFPVNDAGDTRRTRMVEHELPGALNRFIRGLSRLRARGGWDLPADMKLAAEDWATRSNPLSRFVADCVARDPELLISKCAKAGDVRTAYNTWVVGEGITPRNRLQRSHLYEQLAQLGLVISSSPQAGYRRVKGVAKVEVPSDDGGENQF